MELLKHSEWKDTKLTLQLLSQILGKIRLEAAPQEPQWAHVMLALTPDGFSTGLLYYENHVFQVDVDIRSSTVSINVDGHTHSTHLRNGTPIRMYYDFIFRSLRQHQISITINPRPQEMNVKTLLNEDMIHNVYEPLQALRGLELFHFAFREEMKFIGPLRCRKVKPGLFWGTFDVSAIIVQNISEPFPEDKIIEKAAFDEQFIEYGFWLGDERTDEPSFFVLPYPFLNKDLNKLSLEPEEAFYDQEASEYFLTAQAVFDSPAPSKAVQQFFHTTFDILADELKWEGRDYFETPLLMKSQPTMKKGGEG
ncbi:DUF5996 family protein [Planococcus shenhongbingii]|uniref:DUF5996 family protein n=1 Tax=Planococcus shenhongbingii TaxID=3058398 RepID=A0ABT8NF45_9BACL|nr:DUF5996 family protein [Planococcus sp. N017]MDN7246498.1 DUF5996 family protein [Planococcus sp. N017]